MDFELSADQQMLQDALRRFVADDYTFEQRAKALESPHGSVPATWQRLAEQGVLGIGLPEAHGGLGGAVDTMVVMEQLGAGLVLEPFLSTVVIGGGLIARDGSPQQQADLVPRIISGECRIALAHHEAGARYVLDHVKATAREASGGGFLLNGAKTIALDGAVATLFIVSAREESAAEGLSLFLVSADAPGLRITRYRTQDGRNAADLQLTDVKVPANALLGAKGEGLPALEDALDFAIAAQCAEAVGIMDALNAKTLEYLKTRVQFGQPIGRFQVLQHRMADMFMMAVQSRSMLLLATGRCAATDRDARRYAINAAKVYISNAARFIGQQAVQLHGGMGMSAELIVSHYFKRLTTINSTFGDADHHLAAISERILAESRADSLTDRKGRQQA